MGTTSWWSASARSRAACDDLDDGAVAGVTLALDDRSHHLDTVLEAVEPTQSGNRLLATGVIDMKGGLVVGIGALRALDRLNLLNDIPLTFIFNSDEEIGSISSRELIRTEALKHAFAFVLECGGANLGLE